MKILIVEDEARSARRLERLIRRLLPEVERLYVEQGLAEGLRRLADDSVDLLLLDLNLSGKDGFEAVRDGVSRAFHTIVVSAHVDRAVEAFEYGVLDFVPKPVMEPRLRIALDRFRGAEPTERSTRHLIVRRSGSLKRVRVSEVLRVEASGHYSALHLASGRTEFHDKPLDRLIEILPRSFIRAHRSHIVNLDETLTLRPLGGGRYKLRMSDGTELPVGRTRVQSVKERLERGRAGS